MNMDGGLDYKYAKTLPASELSMLSDMINERRKAEEQAINKARNGS